MKLAKHALLVGLGLQGGGVATAKFLVERVTKLTITDLKTPEALTPSLEKLSSFSSIEYALSGHENAPFDSVDLIVIGPSVRRDMPQLLEAKNRGIPVMGETELFFNHNTVPVIGITGTRGKTTTTMLMYEVMQQAGYKTGLGGNIPERNALSLLDEHYDWIVLELSSWQLAGLHVIKKSPHIALFTNFYPDHLNYYASMDDYYYDKSAIFAYQKKSDLFFASKQVPHAQNAIKVDGSEYSGALRLIGDHNRTNASLVYVASKSLNIPDSVATSAISQFGGVPYRLERIAITHGISIYNDTTSTTPVAGVRALMALKSLYKRIYLIAGGNDKNLPYEEWVSTVNSTVSGVVFLTGTMSSKTIGKVKNNLLLSQIPIEHIGEAYKILLGQAKEGDAIVLSPAATSFATFKNEFDRGDQFNACVRDTIVQT